jgi:ElaB/YqjD/DUF883 family membrane-anchored ribosome-binding protein
MNRVGDSSKRTSGKTSTTLPGNRPGSLQAMTDSAYLAEEGRAARAAMSKALANLKHHAAGIADVRPIVKKHPWLTLATAATAGFVAVSTLPTKEEKALKKLAELHRLLNPSVNSSGDPSEKGNGHAPHPPDEGPSILRTIMRHLINIMAPMISSAVTAAFAPPPPQPQPVHPTAAEAATTGDVAT